MVNSVNTNSTQTDQTAADQTQVSATFDQSLATIMSELSGKKIPVRELTNMKISEEMLYAANVYDQLKTTSTAVADTFKKELKERFDRRIKRNDVQPLSKAINDILDNGVKAKKLTAAQYQKIMGTALGKSQLDKSTGLSSSVNQSVKGLDAIHKAVANDSAASTKDVAAFEAQVSKLAFQVRQATTNEQSIRKTIFDSLTTSNSSSPSTGTTKGSTSTKGTSSSTKETGSKKQSGGGVDETSVATLPNDVTRNTSPSDFDFRNKSDVDGKLLIKIPIKWADEIQGVDIQDQSVSTHPTLDSSDSPKKGEDGRLLFRFSKSGEGYGKPLRVHLRFTDGTDDYIVINNPKENFSQGFGGN